MVEKACAALFAFLMVCPGLTIPVQADPSPEVIRACKADVTRLCPFTLRGSEKRRECMREHRSELSKDCIDAIVKSRASGS